MNGLVLGGNSPRHKRWVRELARAMQPHFRKVAYLDYRHWDEMPDGAANIPYEIAQAAAIAKDFGDYTIVAKSIGTVIAALGILQGVLQPRKCLLLGIPLSMFSQFSAIETAYAQLPPTLVVQNERDPLGSGAAVRAFVQKHGNAQTNIQVLPGDTHDYPDYEHIAALAAALSTSKKNAA